MLGGLGTLAGGAIGGFFGGPVGAKWGAAIGGAAGSYLDQRRAQGWQEDQAISQRDFSAAQFATRYQTTVADMKAAGLNPMLAYQQGGGSPPAGVAAAFPGTVGAANMQAYSSARQAEVAETQVEANVSKIAQEIDNLKTDNEKSRAFIDNIREEYQNLVKQGYNLTEIGNQIRATVNNLQQSSDWFAAQSSRSYILQELDKLDLEAAQGLGNVGRELGQIKPFFDILRSVLRPR